MPETNEAHVAKQRVINATSLEVRQARSGSRPGLRVNELDPSIGVGGAVVYALLDVANSIRALREPDEKTARLLSITDSLADAIADGADPAVVKAIVETYQAERAGLDIDQMHGYPVVPERRTHGDPR